MPVVDTASPPRAVGGSSEPRRLSPHLILVAPAIPAVGLMVLWAEHDGGFDADTWYWGALGLLALFVATLIGLGPRRAALSRPVGIALAAFSAYTAWSYVSITWAQTPGLALQGSNRTLLYLLMFALLAILPWTPKAALSALVLFALGVGGVGVVLLARLAAGDGVQQLVIQGRLVAPTGYFNSTVALFMMVALLGVALAIRRELPAALRGVLIALSCASLQLCVMGQSRGWLFTLPLVMVATVAVVRNRLRYALAAAIPVAAALLPVHRLLAVYRTHLSFGFDHAVGSAARTCLIICVSVGVAGTLLAWAEARVRPRRLPRAVLPSVGVALAVLALGAAGVGGLRVTHGHPGTFISHQLRGFIHSQRLSSAGSHFAAVGSGRYDFWRVSLEALRAHPLGGLGQDNFGDYYITQRRTREEPAAPHSIEMSLLSETGIVGFALFAVFAAAALAAGLRARRRGDELAQAVAGAALLPAVVWLIHGSVDWFWELPALTAPALGFLAVAGAVGRPVGAKAPARATPRPLTRLLTVVAGSVLVAAAMVVLALPYLSVREVSMASNIAYQDPAQALIDLRTAAQLNPLSPDPGRIAGTIALETGRYAVAAQRFDQVTSREPGGWYGWVGAGLAASALHQRAVALRDIRVAATINSQQMIIKKVRAGIEGKHPLSPQAALRMLVLVN